MGDDQVPDVMVLSKSCKVCKEAECTMGSESQEFLDWMEKHQDSCNSNLTGSSPAMEAEGASILWARSVEKNQLRYTVVVSDGDDKTISRLNSEHPYGSDVIQVITFMLILFIFMVISNLFTFMVITFFLTPLEDGLHGTSTEAPRGEKLTLRRRPLSMIAVKC